MNSKAQQPPAFASVNGFSVVAQESMNPQLSDELTQIGPAPRIADNGAVFYSGILSDITSVRSVGAILKDSTPIWSAKDSEETQGGGNPSWVNTAGQVFFGATGPSVYDAGREDYVFTHFLHGRTTVPVSFEQVTPAYQPGSLARRPGSPVANSSDDVYWNMEEGIFDGPALSDGVFRIGDVVPGIGTIDDLWAHGISESGELVFAASRYDEHPGLYGWNGLDLRTLVDPQAYQLGTSKRPDRVEAAVNGIGSVAVISTENGGNPQWRPDRLACLPQRRAHDRRGGRAGLHRESEHNRGR